MINSSDRERKDMNTIILDNEKCSGCKTCYKACWLDVIRWDADSHRPVIEYPEDCVECNYCEISCPEDAIRVEIDYLKPFPEPYFAHSTLNRMKGVSS